MRNSLISVPRHKAGFQKESKQGAQLSNAYAPGGLSPKEIEEIGRKWMYEYFDASALNHMPYDVFVDRMDELHNIVSKSIDDAFKNSMVSRHRVGGEGFERLRKQGLISIAIASKQMS